MCRMQALSTRQVSSRNFSTLVKVRNDKLLFSSSSRLALVSVAVHREVFPIKAAFAGRVMNRARHVQALDKIHASIAHPPTIM